MTIYDTYEEAYEDCLDGKEYAKVIDYSFAQVKRYQQQLHQESSVEVDYDTIVLLFSVLLPFATKQKVLRIVDLGGSYGQSYLVFKKLFPHLPLKWEVIEIEEVANLGQQLEDEQLRFYTNFEERVVQNDSIDLIIVSGVLQYIPEQEKYLELIANSRASFLFFNKMSFARGKNDRIIRHFYQLKDAGLGFGTKDYDLTEEYSSPHVSISIDKFELIIEKNYAKKLEFENKTGLIELDSPELIGKGILYELRD